MDIFHYNDEEKELHKWLLEKGHTNTIIPATADPFAVISKRPFDAAFVGLYPHGMRLIQALHDQNPACLVTIITADRNTKSAVQAMRAGAFDYLLAPPLDFTEVESTYIRLLRERKGQEEHATMLDKLAVASAGTRLVGISEPIQNLRRLIAKAAASRAPALILGETGTGKELVARLLHEESPLPRSSGPFVGINCNAIPATLLESELFGYKKGAFTGADADRDGLIAQADGGTLFLDEIHDLDMTLQGKLLRVIQENEVRPLGSKTVRKISARYVTATNQDIPTLIREKKFRQDLYYRLNVVPVPVPPVRQRPEDIALLARYFLDLYARREGRQPLKVTPEVWRWMSAHPWPGNVRELENLCQRAVALSDADTFGPQVLAITSSFTQYSSETGAPQAASEKPETFPSSNPPLTHNFKAARDHADRETLLQALHQSHGNITQAAALISISRTTLYARAKKLNIPLK
jgi:DNA-binding NtrC family response regulator